MRWAFYYRRRGDNDKAEGILKQAIGLAPDNAKAYAALGGIYIRTRRYSEAEHALRKAIALHPTADAYQNLGALYFQLNRYADSVPFLENAVHLGGARSVLVSGLARAYRFTPGLENKAPAKYQEAMRCAERELAINPNDADTRARLAWLYAETSQPGRALEEADRALTEGPTTVEVLLKCILAYELSGERGRALRILRRACRDGQRIEEVQNRPELMDMRNDSGYVSLERTCNGERESHRQR
jgi:serine/threonine-protein kinase